MKRKIINTLFFTKNVTRKIPVDSLFLFLCMMIVFISCSCNPQKEESPAQENVTKQIVIDGFTIPHLSSAGEQLSFAAASHTEPNQQRAFFKSVMQLFPEDRVEVGHAELELAYLDLGTDYRTSLPEQRTSAADNFEKIAKNYHNLPEIAAKALWYHGWVSADLLDMQGVGMGSYHSILDHYAGQPAARSVFPPWTSINLQRESDKTAQIQAQSSITWGELALLELIRHAVEAKDGLLYYHSLITHSPDSSSVPSALTLLATRSDLTPKTIAAIKDEIEGAAIDSIVQKQLNSYLAKDLLEGRSD